MARLWFRHNQTGRAGKRSILHPGTAGNVGIHLNTALCQNVLSTIARRHAGCGNAAGKVAAAAGILTAFIFGICRVIRVAGAQQIRRFCIISAAGVGVADHHGDGGAGGMAVDHTAQNTPPHPARCGRWKAHLRGRGGGPCRSAMYASSTGNPAARPSSTAPTAAAVAFAKNGQAQCVAKGIFHRLSPRFP